MSDKILLVDDEPNVLELMQRQLRNLLQGLYNFSKQVGIKEPICLRMNVNEEG